MIEKYGHHVDYVIHITTVMNLRIRSLAFLPICSLALGMVTAQAEDNHPSSNYLWYNKPAPVDQAGGEPTNFFGEAGSAAKNAWESQALPIGNGRIGAMVFGGAKRERLALNEISFWTGGLNPGGGYNYGPKADENSMGAFQPFADLFIDFGNTSEPENYTRSLNLEDAVSRVSYMQDGVEYKREVYASFPHQVMVMTCTASKPGALSAVFRLKPNHTSDVEAKGNELIMSGTLVNGQAFEGRVVLVARDGKVTPTGGKAKIEIDEYVKNSAILDASKLPSLELKEATSVTVYISLATDYVMDYKKNWKGEAPSKKNTAYLSKALKVQPEALKQAHIGNYRSLFNRVELDLGKSDNATASLPTNERIKAYKTAKNDPELEETLFQYGRYSLISSSRPGTLPANLQGLWNDKVSPPWASDYHSNINIQMNYWLAEPVNLSECQKPLIDFFEAMAEPARIATQKAFKTPDGNPVRGWTVRTSQNPFGGQGWEWNIPGSAWYARHIWEHYIFTMDNNYLRNQAYPMMKEISQYWEDHLKPLGKDGEGFMSGNKPATQEMLAELKGIKAGTLVAPNGWSPEHGPREDGVSHDQQLIWDLFTNTAMAANILGVDKQWASELLKKRDRLAGPKIGKEGNLQEWMIDRIAKTQHRHTSHLYAVYPGNQITVEKTPELAEAARKSLEWRGTTGDSRRSWTWPWRTALWARFKDGERAHEMVSGLIEHNLLDNMLATHPPMQMDGTYGITGGMVEMLIQSHNLGEIAILPAPTKAWPTGSAKGLKARGNVTVNFDWKEGKVTNVELFSPNKRPVKVTYNGKTTTMTPKQLPAERKASGREAARSSKSASSTNR